MLAFIQRQVSSGRLDRGLSRVVLAVSGGADSMALLHALDALWTPRGIVLVVAHVHHGIRPEPAAAADAAFVEQCAKSRGLSFRMCRVDVPAEAAASGESLEMSARRLRSEALCRVARSESAQAICTGHTADDQLETLCLRMARGSGPRGLGGMSPRARHLPGVLLLRPLLECRRTDLRDWLRREAVSWREDASNEEDSIPRNRVRRTLLPVLEDALGPSGVGNALRTMALLREEEERWIEPMVQRHLQQACRIQAPDAKGSLALECRTLRDWDRPLVRRVLLRWLQQQEFPARCQSLNLLDLLTGFALDPSRGTREIALGGGWTARRRYEVLVLEKERLSRLPLPPCALSVPGVTPLPSWNLEVEIEEATGFIRGPRMDPLLLPQTAYLDGRVVAGRTLTLRSIRPGDRMRPLGSAGSRKLSDILIDRKISRDQRPHVPVLLCGQSVAWLPGHSVDTRFAVPGGESRSLRITLRPWSSRGGFSLVETLVALMLTGLVLLPSVLLLQRLLTEHQRLETRLGAELVARHWMEEALEDASREEAGRNDTRVRTSDGGTFRIVLRHWEQTADEPARVAVETFPSGSPSTPVRSLSRHAFPPHRSTFSP